MRVTVAYAATGVEALTEITLPEGAVVTDAIVGAGLLERLGLDPRTIGYAIHGQRAEASTPLRDGDRVDITRALVIEPKTARRSRAQAHQVPRRTSRRKPPPLA